MGYGSLLGCNWSITGFIEIGNQPTITPTVGARGYPGENTPAIGRRDFHGRKNSRERVVITVTRGQCVPIRGAALAMRSPGR